MRYLSAKDEDMQSQLRSLAQEVVSEITAVDPARSRELLSAFVSELVLAVADESRREERRQPLDAGSFREIVRQEPYPVAGKAAEIMDRLRRGITSFRLLFRGSRSRSEVVATFLAVLELCRARMIHLAGGESECTVTPTGETADALPL